MSLLFLDGFDAYTNRQDATAGKWSIGSFSTGGNIVTGRLGDFAGDLSGQTLGRGFGAVSTIIIGCAIKFTYYGLFGDQVFIFYDASSQVQTWMGVDTFGRLVVYRGNNTSNLLAISAQFMPLNTWNYLEFGLHIGTGTSGAVTVRVNNQVVINTSANTQATTDTTTSAVVIGGSGGANVQFDDLYLCDTAGSVNNGYLGDLRVETLFPDGDDTVNLTPINSMGNSDLNATTSDLSLINSNEIFVYRVQCNTNGTVADALINFESSNLTCKTKFVIYTDSAGSVSTLLTNGVSNEVVGAIANTPTSYTFATPPTLTAGTFYWIGVMTDSQIWTYQNPYTAGKGHHARATNTYTSGAPSTLTSPSLGTDSPQYAVQIVLGTNYTAVNEQQEDQDYSYVYSNNPGDSDLYTYQDLSADSQTVYGIQVSPMIRKTHTAARTGTIQMQTPTMSPASSATLAPGVNYAYFPSVFNYQSDGATTWTVAAVNGIKAGITVA